MDISYLAILEVKGSEIINDGDFDDNEDETEERNVDVHDEYDNNAEFSSIENNINYESDYRPSASVAQLVKGMVLTSEEFNCGIQIIEHYRYHIMAWKKFLKTPRDIEGMIIGGPT